MIVRAAKGVLSEFVGMSSLSFSRPFFQNENSRQVSCLLVEKEKGWGEIKRYFCFMSHMI